MTEHGVIRFHEVYSAPGAALTVVCCPFAGAGHAPYMAWAEHLTGVVDVVVADLPGRGLRAGEGGAASLSAAAAELADTLGRTFTPDRTAVFGHSLGGLLAYETSLRLQPFAVIVSGCRAPRTLVTEPMTANFLSHLPRLFVAAYRQDASWITGYRLEPGRKIDAPLLVIAGTRDSVAPIEGCLPWRHEAARSFSFASVPGEHLYVAADSASTVAVVEGWLTDLLHQTGVA